MQLRLIACALFLLYLPACTGWSNVEMSGMKQMINTDHPKALRVTLRNGSVMVLDQPKVAFGDSLSGGLNGAPSIVALRDVTQVEIRRVNERATTAIFFGVAVGAIATMVLLNEGGDDEPLAP